MRSSRAICARLLDAYGLGSATIEAYHPAAADAAALAELREVLAANEFSAKDLIVLYYNQGVITGDWNGPHVSPLGAYDAANDRVLIMDIDRHYYVPYWTSVATLLAALVKPAPADQGELAGQTGGYIVLRQ